MRVLCRPYLKQQFLERKLAAAREGRKVTESFLIMQALVAAGYYIAAEDLQEDGRGKVQTGRKQEKQRT